MKAADNFFPMPLELFLGNNVQPAVVFENEYRCAICQCGKWPTTRWLSHKNRTGEIISIYIS